MLEKFNFITKYIGELMNNVSLISIIMALGMMTAFAQLETVRAEDYEGHYNFINDYPSARAYYMSEELQGVAHDDAFWYFAQRNTLWKIPVSNDLNSNSSWTLKKNLSDVPELNAMGMDHFGDLDYAEYGGEGFLFVPTEGSSPSVIAVFDTDFNFKGYQTVSALQENHAPWCGVERKMDGDYLYLYSSKYNYVEKLIKYKIDMNLLLNNNTFILEWVDNDFDLKDQNGLTYSVDEIQGGEFSASDGLLYISSIQKGITVFESATGKLVERSTNGSGYFDFEYNTNIFERQEPEGLTIWDLDEKNDSNIKGQLHVVLLVNDDVLGPTDDIYFKHYTNKIYVDGNVISGSGKPDDPFQTVGEALSLAWEGAIISIKSNTYTENMLIDKKIKMTATGGPVIIGNVIP